MGDTGHTESSREVNEKSTCDIIQRLCCSKFKFSKITDYGEPGSRGLLQTSSPYLSTNTEVSKMMEVKSPHLGFCKPELLPVFLLPVTLVLFYVILPLPFLPSHHQ